MMVAIIGTLHCKPRHNETKSLKGTLYLIKYDKIFFVSWAAHERMTIKDMAAVLVWSYDDVLMKMTNLKEWGDNLIVSR